MVDFGPKASPRLGLKAYGNLWALFVKNWPPNQGRYEGSSLNEGREVTVGRGKRGKGRRREAGASLYTATPDRPL